MKGAAKIISYLFHPLFVPVYMLGITLFLPVYALNRYGTELKMYMLAFIFLLDVLLPLISLSFMKRYKIIGSMQLENARERTIPYVLMFFLYSLTAWSLGDMAGMHPIIPIAFVMSALIIVVVNFANRYFKVSAHSAAMAAATTWFYLIFKAFAIDTSLLLMIAVVLTGLVMSSRLAMGAHSPREVYWGAAIGAAVPLVLGAIVIG